MTNEEILKLGEKFRYQLLDRMKQDCEYYLGYGRKNPRHLWAIDEKEHIEIMKTLYNSFSDDKKPEWISMQDIERYEMKMVHKTCPKCGKEYTGRPALSREDNETEICPECGIMEALSAMGVSL